jgi:hypothetical protein
VEKPSVRQQVKAAPTCSPKIEMLSLSSTNDALFPVAQRQRQLKTTNYKTQSKNKKNQSDKAMRNQNVTGPYWVNKIQGYIVSRTMGDICFRPLNSRPLGSSK